MLCMAPQHFYVQYGMRMARSSAQRSVLCLILIKAGSNVCGAGQGKQSTERPRVNVLCRFAQPVPSHPFQSHLNHI